MFGWFLADCLLRFAIDVVIGEIKQIKMDLACDANSCGYQIIKYPALLTADHEVLLRVLLAALHHLEAEPPTASCAHRRLARA